MIRFRQNRNLLMWAVLGCMAIGGVWFHWFGFVQIGVPMPGKVEDFDRPGFGFYGDLVRHDRDEAWVELSRLMDSAPLFLPTRFNYAADINHVASLREETELFQHFEPILQESRWKIPEWTRTEPGLDLDHWVDAPPSRDLIAFGVQAGPEKQSEDVPAPRLRGPRVDVVELTGGTRRSLDLPHPGDVEMPAELWEPLRILMQIQWGRPVGAVIDGPGSGFGDWDRVLLEWSQAPDVYRQLFDGYWRVEWYP